MSCLLNGIGSAVMLAMRIRCVSTLRSWAIEPQAIEQPLDIAIPENKLMLAIYLSTPEVKNDRRALDVVHGMRRARKERRWMSLELVGYKNITFENGNGNCS